MVFLQEFIFLKDISRTVLFVSVFGSVYLHLFFLFRLKKQEVTIFSGLSRKKTTFLCFAIACIVYIAAASGYLFSPYPITGDEPHYLLITKSLISDGDINLWNNNLNKDYLEFYPGRMDSHTKMGNKGPEFQYSRHMPGLPLLLVPSYILGSQAGKAVASILNDPTYERWVLIFAIRLFICIVTSGLCGMFYLTTEALLKNRNISLISWGLFSFSTPLLFYSFQIYPEVFASFLAIFLLYLLVIKRNYTSNHSSILSQIFWCSRPNNRPQKTFQNILGEQLDFST